MPEWSQQLRNETKRILSLQDPLPFAMNHAMGRDGVILKNSNGRFGTISMKSCQTKCFQIIEMNSKSPIDSYISIEDLIAGGWVVD